MRSLSLRRAVGVVSFAWMTGIAGSAMAAGPVPGDAPAPAAPAPTPAPAAPPAAEAPAQPASDNHPAPNSIFAEGLGAGIAYSINYERLLNDDVGVRVGFSYLSFSSSASDGMTTSTSKASFVTIPITASYIGIRGRKSSLELGGGVSLNYASGSASGLGESSSGSGITPLMVAMVGYRLHPVDGAGFQFRVGLMALAGEGLSLSSNNPGGFGVLPWGYLSMGASY